ncbi:GNAT family N-acetyltransferase [Deinococcus hopiensis]|nr:GNAT family N-acetyltransferase [Deinococcus hopiensis]
MTELTLTWSDVEAASRVLIATATHRAKRGEPLWTPTGLTPERLSRHYPAQGWRVAWQGGQAVATYVLLDADTLFWPDDLPGVARYLHKLGVHPDAQGQGLSARMLEDAVQQTHRKKCSWLRLDTAANRPKLRALYENAGFRRVDEVEVKGLRVVRYELPIMSG